VKAFRDGAATDSRFRAAGAIDVAPDGTVYVIDIDSVRMLRAGALSTVAGSPGALPLLAEGSGDSVVLGYIRGVQAVDAGLYLASNNLMRVLFAASPVASAQR
jgi:hypothetical protein